MLVKLKTFSLLGIDAVPVEVEIDCADIRMPKIILVGLPEAAVVEGLRVFPVASLMQSTPNFIVGQVCGQIGFSEPRAFQKELPRALQILCKRQVSRHVFSSQVNYAHV